MPEAPLQTAELFTTRDVPAQWQREWWGMPEFIQEDLTPWKSIKVHFASGDDMESFARVVEQTVPGRGPGGSIWYPEAEIGHFKDKRYVAQ